MRADQDAQAVDGLPRLAFQLRPLRGARGEEALRPRDVQLRAEAGLKTRSRDRDGVALGPERVLQNPDLLLDAAQLGVGAGDVGQQRHQHVPATLLRRLRIGQRRFPVPPDAAEDVDLPGRVEARLEEVLVALAERRAVPGSRLERRHGVAAPGPRVGGLGGDLGQARRGRDPRRRARLADPGGRDLEVEVALHGARHEALEHRIVEGGPPGPEGGTTPRYARALGPGHGHGDARPLVPGSDGAARGRAQDEQRDERAPRHRPAPPAGWASMKTSSCWPTNNGRSSRSTR